MRFRAPRSISPSPVRGKPRNTSSFGIHSDSESEEYESELEPSFAIDSDDENASVASSSSSSSFQLVSDINKLSLRPRHITRTPLEQREIDETVAAIRLRAQYVDPYEEWEKAARKDAFKAARKEFDEKQLELQKAQEQQEARMVAKAKEDSKIEDADVARELDMTRKKLLDFENDLRKGLKQRNDDLWARIEAAIKVEEDKIAAQIEGERKAKAEKERQQKEAELKKRLAAEKKLEEETAKKKAEEEMLRAKEEKERQEKEEKEKLQKLQAEEDKRNADELDLRTKLNLTIRKDDWHTARTKLQQLKTTIMRPVKSNPEVKAEWGRLRRQIVPKIGQLTNDPAAIARISQQIIEILNTHQGQIRIALCSSVAKTILLQAETEVVAEKRSAPPLAQVAFNLLDAVEDFPIIFFSRLVQRSGGWPIPIVVPSLDIDGFPWNEHEDRVKASGVRKSISSDNLESTEEYMLRVSAIMRVYFHILKIQPVNRPLHPMFQLPRYWTWFARMMNDPSLLRDPVAAQLIYTGLDVLGLEGLDVWGQQWVKVLALIHEGITDGYEKGKLIGGDTTEGAAARTRILVTLENIFNTAQS